MMRTAAALAILLATAAPARAHAPSTAHLRLEPDGAGLAGRLDLAVSDLDAAIGIDDGDGAVTWGELAASAPRIEAYITPRLALAGCSLVLESPALVDLSDGPYVSIALTAGCTSGGARTLAYSLLFDVDAQHRAIVHVPSRTVIVRDPAPISLAVDSGSAIPQFVREGVWHIWIGLDHILFLLCLLLPAVLGRHSLRAVTVEVLEIVTAFTLAHSITLVISATGVVTLPSRVVEPAIALSVVAAAANNLVGVVQARWAVAFALGLLHGFGFSSVLLDLGLPTGELVGALLGFNLGVELGQAAIVVAILPILYAIRATLAFRALLYAGSAATAIVAVFWTYDRLAS